MIEVFLPYQELRTTVLVLLLGWECEDLHGFNPNKPSITTEKYKVSFTQSVSFKVSRNCPKDIEQIKNIYSRKLTKWWERLESVNFLLWSPLSPPPHSQLSVKKASLCVVVTKTMRCPLFSVPIQRIYYLTLGRDASIYKPFQFKDEEVCDE